MPEKVPQYIDRKSSTESRPDGEHRMQKDTSCNFDLRENGHGDSDRTLIGIDA